MIELFYNYVVTFLHPFKNQEELRLIRSKASEVAGVQTLRLAGELGAQDVPTSSELEKASSMRFIDILGVSWFFVAIEAFYAVLALHLGQVFFQSWSEPNDLALLLPLDTSMYTHRVLLTAAIGKVTFFPIIFWIYAKFWKTLIRFFAGLFQVEGNPIFGKMLRHMSGLLHLFAGLRNNMQMTVLQSVVIILSPAIIMTMLSSMFMVTILYLISISF